MSYIVKTTADRNLVIDADHLTILSVDGNQTPTAYHFFKKNEHGSERLVASVPAHNVFAVIHEDAEVSDHYGHYDWSEEDAKETAAPYQDLLANGEFVDAFLALVDAWHYDASQDDPLPLPEPRVERRICEGNPQWGFISRGFFVPFGDNEDGKTAAERNTNSDPSEWFAVPLSDTAPLPEDDLPETPKVEKRKYFLSGDTSAAGDGYDSWGFVHNGSFVPFGPGPDSKKEAERNALENPDNPNWFKIPIFQTEVIQ